MYRTFHLMLVRHAETEWNALGVLQGHIDQPLNNNGHLQAIRLGKRIAPEKFTDIFVSDLIRAQQTYQIAQDTQATLQGGQKTPKVEIDKRLREKSYGNMEGRPRSELIEAAKKAGVPAIAFVPDAGESNENLSKRVQSFFVDVCERVHKLNGADAHNAHMLVVTHGGWMRTFFVMLRDDFGCQFHNCDLGRVVANAGRCSFVVTLPPSSDDDSEAIFSESDRDVCGWTKGITVKCTEFDVT